MLLESAQMLCTALDLRGFGFPDMYRPTHQGHPCTVWAAETLTNYEWLASHAFSLSEEYSCRTGKVHASHGTIEHCFALREGIPEGELTDFPNCTPHKDMPTLPAYRLTMIEKWESDVRIPVWSHREPPYWATAKIRYHRLDNGVYVALR